MTVALPPIAALDGAYAPVYASLSVMVFSRVPLNRTGAWFRFMMPTRAIRLDEYPKQESFLSELSPCWNTTSHLHSLFVPTRTFLARYRCCRPMPRDIGTMSMLADKLVMVRSSVGKINRLLSRLHLERQERDHALIMPSLWWNAFMDIHRASGAVEIISDDQSDAAGASVDPDLFDAMASHLLKNAFEACQKSVRDFTDHGAGRLKEFVLNLLFRPFSCTKDGGYGIEAYQARELPRSTSGNLLAISPPGHGTAMQFILISVGIGLTEPILIDA